MKICALFSLVICFTPFAVRADFQCSVDVSYSWIKTTGSSTPAAATPAAGDSTTVHFALVEQRAVSQEEAKQQMEGEINRTKIRASEQCRREHENLAACSGSKFQQNASILSSLGFSARRELERAILDDCKATQGRCMGIQATEPKCSEVIVPVTPTPSAAAGKAGKDDEKKKK